MSHSLAVLERFRSRFNLTSDEVLDLVAEYLDTMAEIAAGGDRPLEDIETFLEAIGRALYGQVSAAAVRKSEPAPQPAEDDSHDEDGRAETGQHDAHSDQLEDDPGPAEAATGSGPTVYARVLKMGQRAFDTVSALLEAGEGSDEHGIGDSVKHFQVHFDRPEPVTARFDIVRGVGDMPYFLQCDLLDAKDKPVARGRPTRTFLGNHELQYKGRIYRVTLQLS